MAWSITGMVLLKDGQDKRDEVYSTRLEDGVKEMTTRVIEELDDHTTERLEGVTVTITAKPL